MSNYPPGVSGHEPQIAGYPESEQARHVQCEIDPCQFQGTVVATVVEIASDEIEIDWVCPECKGVNEQFEELDRGPDPDDQRDRANDERDS